PYPRSQICVIRVPSPEVPMSRLIASIVAVALCGPSPAADPDAHAANRRLGRGVDLGNALEAPREGAWGLTLKADYFRAIKDAGFDSVRLPVKWSAHAQADAPYTINPAFFERVDWAIDQALANDLNIVVNVHHYDEMATDPDKHLPRL